MKDLNGRQVLFFRAHIDPAIGPMPKCAIHSNDVKTIMLSQNGIYVETLKGEEHLIPYTNVETIKIKPCEVGASKK